MNDNGRIRTYACEHNAYDVSEEIAGHRLNHSATLSCHPAILSMSSLITQ
ncbi:hypothetical protein FG05_35071 [Fusarium graminearum]|nr:hypothetical protein FG05_35071 [Fusarium graminearum]